MAIILNNEQVLRAKCDEVTLKEGLSVSRKLQAELRRLNKPHHRQALGLAATQIGLAKQVCVVVLPYYLPLLNPLIIDHSGVALETEESCLSFPGKFAKTKRWPWIVVSALNLKEPMMFGSKTDVVGNSFLEATAAQHEIDHLNGRLIFDGGVG